MPGQGRGGSLHARDMTLGECHSIIISAAKIMTTGIK